MFRVKVHIRRNETLHFRYRYRNIRLPCTAAPSIPSDTYHHSYHKQSIGFRLHHPFCVPFTFPFSFPVVWALNFLDWFSNRSFVDKIDNRGGLVFLTFFSLLSFVDLLVVVRSAPDIMMLLVLQKSVFIENEAAQQCVTMRKRFRTIMATIWYKSFGQNICSIENRNVWPHFKAPQLGNVSFHKPSSYIFLISSSYSISSTISRGKVFRGDPKKSFFRYK